MKIKSFLNYHYQLELRTTLTKMKMICRKKSSRRRVSRIKGVTKKKGYKLTEIKGFNYKLMK